MFFPISVVARCKNLVHLTGIVAAALVLLAVAGCSSPVRGNAAVASIERAGPPHVAPAEATARNAGAEHCDLHAPVDIAVIEQSDDFAIGFGERGGLIAWSTSEGTRVRPLSTTGAATGAGIVIDWPRTAKPVEVVPFARGFLVVGKRVEYRMSACESQCTDATCAGWPAGTPQPHVCSYPCLKPCQVPNSQQFVMQYVDLTGKSFAEPTMSASNFVDLEAVIQGDGRSIGLVTGDEMLWIRTNDRDAIVLNSRSLPRIRYALPVRGKGSPTLLGLDEDGSAQMIDEYGVHAVKGSLIDGRSGRIIDARLQARWDSNGRLHVARQAWMISLDSIHYAVIDNFEVRSVLELGERGFREPFAEYVEPHLEDGRFRRSSWLQRVVGDDIDLRRKDPKANANHARFAWTGKSFLFAYPAFRSLGETLRTMIADCSGITHNARLPRP
jgi:hypothetical protein